MDGSGSDAAQDSVENWLQSIKIELENLSPVSNWSIWRVPTNLRTVNEDAYSPRIISIGPFHHGTQNVMGMEVQKWHYMRCLLSRTQNTEKTLEACGRAILGFDRVVRAYYGQHIEYSNAELAKMLLLDGCFIIELFLRYSKVDFGSHEDIIFTSSWMILTLQRDLALLENQIPYLVLECLFKFVAGPANDKLLHELALYFFQPILYINTRNDLCFNRQIRHLLDLIHYCCLPSSPKSDQRSTVASEYLTCATTLLEAGIEFEKGTEKNLFELRFEKGKFNIPALRMHDSTTTFFQNLIAYEQCFHDRERLVTSYFILMDRLINSTKDVELLVNKQIIENDFGSRKDVLAFFNSVCKNVVSQDSYFAGLCMQVNAYYHTRWYRYRADLRRNYFSSPWTITSLIAGVLLLSLTALQAIYSVICQDH